MKQKEPTSAVDVTLKPALREALAGYDELLTADQVARLLQLSMWRLRHMCNRDEIRFIRSAHGGHLFFRQEDIAEWLKKFGPLKPSKKTRVRRRTKAA